MGRGRNRGGRGQGRGGGRGYRGDNRGEDNRVSFDKVEKTNEKLERYYNAVLNLSDKERSDFWAALKRELPNSFRFAGSKGNALAVQKLLRERYIPQISEISHYDGTLVNPPQPVPWYPDDLAWWMTTPKNVVRRFPPFAAFQKYLVSETSVGNISRQEVVSMIPPLVMDLRPGMTVLDLCAAPGSKAAQLLEMVHLGEEQRIRQSLHAYAETDGRAMSPDADSKAEAIYLDVDNSDDGRATGLLIANDADYKRSHMLIHQLKRLSSPNLIVMNHDATMFPSIKLPSTPDNPSENRYLKFDRILADVPCSGDGTTRKNVNLWKDWNPQNALGLYLTQVRILLRALQMLKPGGRVVYSTCSMNPVENEAVVASAIHRAGGLEKISVVESDDQLPLLKRRPGLKNWTVMDKNGKVWKSYKEVLDYHEALGREPPTAKIAPGMFPPAADSPEAEIPFERCMRVYAHLQDTGGFFITILEKKAEFRAKPEREPTKDEPMPPISDLIEKLEEAADEDKEEGGVSLATIDSKVGLAGADIDDGAEKTPAARQNQEGTGADATKGAKRSIDEVDVEGDPEIDAAQETKKLKTKENVDIVEEGHDRKVHFPPPPAAELNLTTRPGDMRVDNLTRIRNKAAQQFEEPFKYIPATQSEVQSIERFYHLSPRFPRDRFMVRNAEAQPAKTIYYTSALIRDVLTENEGKGMKFVHGGVKMFMKQDVQNTETCKWRIQSEGMPILEGYVGEERVVRLYKRETLRKLLIEMFPKVAEDGWKDLGEIGERVRDIAMGCCVLRIEPSADADGFTDRMVLPLWRSAASLNLMLAKEDRTAMLLRLFNDTTPLVNNSLKLKEQAAAKKLKEEEDQGGVKLEDNDEVLEDVKDEQVEDTKEVANGFVVNNGEIKVDTSAAIESAAPVKTEALDAAIHPGPYSSVVGEKDELKDKSEATSSGLA